MDPETRRQLEAERLARVAARQQAQLHVINAPAQSLADAAGDAAAHVPAVPTATHTFTDTTTAPAAATTTNVKKRPRSPSPLPSLETEEDTSRSAPPPAKMARRDDQGDRRRASRGTASNDRVVVVLSSDTDDGSDDDIQIVEPKSAAAAPAAASSSSSSASSASTSAPARQYKIPPAVPRSTGPQSQPHGAQPKYLSGGFYMTAVGSPTSTPQYSTVRFSDLVDKNHITAAILSSYVWEEEWLLPHFPADIRFCFINNAKSPIKLEPSLASSSKLISPPLTAGGAFGCMHTKLCLLVYPTFIRFALGSANLIAYDWTGMANVIYVHDFPRLTPTSPPDAAAFYTSQLAPLLRDLGVPEGIHKIVGQCDSSGMGKNGRRLVRSRPGYYLPGDGYGLAGMVDAVKAMGLPKDKDMVMTCATSSVGSLDAEYLRMWGNGIMRGGFAPSASSKTEVRVVYPTSDEVVRSVYGAEGGGSVWLRKEVWDKPDFPRDRFWTLDARCRGFLSHAKTIVFLPKDASSTPTDGKTPIGLYYAGSHNFTRAAWGSLTKRESKCRMSNYETGIVCPITSADQIGRSLPVAYGTGSRKYELGKELGKGGDLPWMQEMFR